MIGFLVRMVFWLSLVFLSLPATSGGDDARTFLRTRHSEATAIVQSAEDMVRVCGKNPTLCSTGVAALKTIGAGTAGQDFNDVDGARRPR